ncbi:uncharacterized protein MELLADRAFT_105703 [Melampsora larici-populina 98AG31]|uniref:Secreted protein n=1 Tax=Melampsora larici-populina (strain 98AG31 / pathotype 3-4-7) TaxID=747676 RepID=F4RJ36_MELLP|nr:uncharacterized protein MELLADRAFT_105703 [Melampsora larici-populina 98AG31]EGG07721.1 hypothetical protein MELLADRAFT_105703 [Melampsora larici-populina 98AG31]
MRSCRILTACAITALMTLLVSKPCQGLPTPPFLSRTVDPWAPCEGCLPISTSNTYTESGMSWTYSRKFPMITGTEESYDDPAYRSSSPQEVEAIVIKADGKAFGISDEQYALPERSEEDSSTRGSYIYVTGEDSLNPEDFDEDD